MSNKPIRVAIVNSRPRTRPVPLLPVPELTVDIYEQAGEIKEIGAGIVFWPPLVWRIMKSDEGVGRDIFELYHMGGPNLFHRAAAQKTLLNALPPNVQIHLAHRLLSYHESNDSVQLNFDNQPSKTCELLVAADGIKSGIRKEFIEKRFPEDSGSIDPVWGGTIAYRSLIRTERIRERFPDHPSLSKSIVYIGKGKSTITYPIMQGKLINVVMLVNDFSKEGTRYDGPTTKPADIAYVRSQFEGWSEEFLSLLDSIETCSAWAIQYLTGLKSYAVGRVLLMGDAAHAMPPTLGSGAGQAVEDAYILSLLLAKAVKDNVPMSRVTEAYTKVRQPLANLVLQRSHDMGKMATFSSPELESFNDENEETREVLLKKYVEEFESMFDWWKEYPVEKEVEKALGML
ncbi:salicylate hydroxylase [Cyathus striatus]|nr:salicylate hydroxylase [Cyathus striatus]